MVNCVSDMHHVNEVVCYCDKAVRLCRDVTLRIQATPAEILDTVRCLEIEPLPAEAALRALSHHSNVGLRGGVLDASR